MGAKFASLHLRTDNIEEIVELIQSSEDCNKPKADEMMWRMYSLIDNDKAKFVNAEQENALMRLFSLNDELNNQYNIVDNQNGWVSIFNEDYAWESIEHEGKKLSKSINCPIMAIGYFDDDVFEISIINNDKVITKHVVGDGLECYGVRQKRMSINKFLNELHIEISDSDIKSALEEDDIFNLSDRLENILGLQFRFNCEEEFKIIRESQGCKVLIKHI